MDKNIALILEHAATRGHEVVSSDIRQTRAGTYMVSLYMVTMYYIVSDDKIIDVQTD